MYVCIYIYIYIHTRGEFGADAGPREASNVEARVSQQVALNDNMQLYVCIYIYICIHVYVHV